MEDKLTTIEQINKKYGTQYECELNEYGIKLFNGEIEIIDLVSLLDNMNADDCDITCIYCELTNNVEIYEMCVDKLLKMNVPIAYHRMGCYLVKKNNAHTEKSYEYFSKAFGKGHVSSIVNMTLHCLWNNNATLALENMRLGFINGKQKEICLNVAIFYSKLNPPCLNKVNEWLLRGIEYESEQCYNFFVNLYMKNDNETYLWLNSFNDKNTLILNKIKELEPYIDVEFYKNNKESKLIFE